MPGWCCWSASSISLKSCKLDAPEASIVMSAPLLPHVGFRAERLGIARGLIIEAPHAMGRAGEPNSRARSSKDPLDWPCSTWLAIESPALLPRQGRHLSGREIRRDRSPVRCAQVPAVVSSTILDDPYIADHRPLRSRMPDPTQRAPRRLASRVVSRSELC